MDKKLEWQAPEYLYRERSNDWFWAVGIIALSLSATSVLLSNTLFAIVILIGTFSLMLYAKRKPRLVKFGFDEKGVRTGRTLYPYTTIAAFWVEDRIPLPKIIFKSKKITMPYIILPLDADAVSPDEARGFLGRRLAENEMAEPISLKIMEFLGF